MLSLRLVLMVLFTFSAALAVWRPMVALAASPGTVRAQKFIDAHVAKLRPLEIRAGQAWWDANVSGKDEDFKRKEEAQNRIDEALADAAAFKELQAIKAGGGIDDRLVARQIEVLARSPGRRSRYRIVNRLPKDASNSQVPKPLVVQLPPGRTAGAFSETTRSDDRVSPAAVGAVGESL